MRSRILKNTLLCVVFFLLAVGLFAAGGKEVADNGKKNVAVSFDAIKELTFAVAKDKVNISVIVPEGMEPHDFEPKAKDLMFLSNADVLIFNGLEMEFWLEDSLKAVNNKKLLKVEASKGIEKIKASHHHHHGKGEVCPVCGEVHEEGEEHHHDEDGEKHHHDKEHHKEGEEHHHHHHCNHGEFDPHVWLSPSAAIIMVKNIANELGKVDSANAAFYDANVKAYVSELTALINEYKTKFKTVRNRHFVTGHAAFAYLCRDFELEQEAVMGVFAEGEPNAKELAELVEHCKEHKIKVIFSEEAASPEISATLAKEVNAKVEEIYTMEMPQDNKSYMERMKSNLEKIYNGLK